jgi:hypothetical protein
MLAVTVGGTLLIIYLTNRAWDEAVAEADRLDPGWRFADLEAQRAAIADADNSARCILAAHALLPSPWPSWPTLGAVPIEAFQKSLRELPPNAPLTAQQTEALTAARTAAAKALATARKLKDLPSGRYAVVLDPRGSAVQGAHGAELRAVGDLLAYDVLLRLHREDPDGALESCRALVNVARSCGDAPDFMYQIHRMELRTTACRHIERTLMQGRLSAAGLLALQRLLEDEEAQPLFLHGARGFRCDLHQLLESARQGKAHQSGMVSWAQTGLAANVGPVSLRVTTRVVESGKRPVEDLQAQLQRTLPASGDGPYLARVYIWPKVEKVAGDLSRGQLRSQAALRCTIAALAAERYRLANGKLPGSLAELVPAQLRAVPTDPYNGQPVRYRVLGGGVVIYSVGPNGTDDLGNLDRTGTGLAGTDVGIQMKGD